MDLYSQINDRDKQVCETCGEKLDRLVATFNAHVWKPLTLEHIDRKPITFNSKQELIKTCREKGVSSGALL
jgi:hypothetical protein